jgi:hypothetical protein
VAVNAVAAPGWGFDHWELDGVNEGGSRQFTATMNSDHSLKAVFLMESASNSMGGVPAYPVSAISTGLILGLLLLYYKSANIS